MSFLGTQEDTEGCKEHHGAVDESSLAQQFHKLSMAQWVNLYWHNSFVIFLYEKVLVGLTAGRQSDKILVVFKI